MKKTNNKHPLTLVLLAIFFGVFAWLYIFDKRETQFWVGTILSVILCWTIVVPVGMYIWALVDCILYSDSLY
jgi:Na+-transporting NADH:ubiquinone oxidoreductase subunit NqrE